MPKDRKDEPRALPGAVFVPEETLKMIVKRVALLSDKNREQEKVIVVRPGYYRASTDQVVLYQHQSRMPPPKADLSEVVICTIREVTTDHRLMMGAPTKDNSFLDFMRDFWDKSLELDSPVTLIICFNLRGGLVDQFVETFRFHGTLSGSGQE